MPSSATHRESITELVKQFGENAIATGQAIELVLSIFHRMGELEAAAPLLAPQLRQQSIRTVALS